MHAPPTLPLGGTPPELDALVAARRVADDRVEVVVRLKKKPGDPTRLPRADILDHARALLEASGVVDVDVRIFDPALCTVV